MLQAYNDWHIDEWCGAHPGRFIPLALPVMWDPELAAEEVHRVSAKGCTAISFSQDPQPLGFPSLHADYWDPFWKACADTDSVICIHIGSAGGMHFTSADAPVDVMITTTPISIVNCAADLLWCEALKKYPLKIALSEGGIGWIPYFLERADYVYEHHHAWTNQDFGGKKPSDVFREHILTCFIDDAAGVKNRHDVGLHTIMWECDYPHSDTPWPQAPERLMEYLEGVPEAEIHAMTHENAMREYRLDSFGILGRENCSVGALRAQSPDVDLSVKSIRGGKPPSFEPGKPVTTADVTQQLMTAFQTPAE
jgi:predicted TIM-barrel fold metal-dependent hydrolase